MGQPDPDNHTRRALTLNRALVDQLKSTRCIQTLRVETAFREVLRHLFLPETPLEEAYSDRAISAKQDQKGQWLSSSSQPAMMAIMLEQLGLKPGHKVLEIGTGTGYNAALMARIVGDTGRIITVEIDEDLAETARRHLASTGFERVQVICADGGYGFAEAAPFDRIVLTVGAPDITPAWRDQLKPDGRMVLPLILKGSMNSIAFEKVKDHLVSVSVKDCSFLPLRGDFALTPAHHIGLGPDPDLYVEPVDEFPIDGNAAYHLLTGESHDWPTGVEVTAWDATLGRLWTWLALHEPRLCKLVAEGDLVKRKLVPALIGMDGQRKLAGTVAVLDKTGLAVLTRPPDRPVPLPADQAKLFAPDSPLMQPFDLFVRQFGPDESTRRRLIAEIQSWDAAGRPSTDAMRIRAYPKGFEYKPSEGEHVIEKPWTKLVLEWPATN